MFLSVLLGLIVGPIFIASNTTIQVVSDETMRGKVFSSLEIIIHLAFLLSMLLSSWLAGMIGRVGILMGAGVLFSCVAIVGFILSRCKGGLAFK